jgi:hypothetical protein
MFEIYTFTSKRSIRTEVDTYRFYVDFESLKIQQLNGFNEWRNDQGAIRNQAATTNFFNVDLYFCISKFTLLKNCPEIVIRKNEICCRNKIETTSFGGSRKGDCD